MKEIIKFIIKNKLIILFIGIVLSLCFFYTRKSCPTTNKYEKEFDTMLQWFEDFSTNYHVNYSLAYGTLLGYIRNKNYIPYDGDADLFIGKHDAYQIIKLIDNETIFYNSEIREIDKNKIYLIINKDHNEKINNRKRFNCKGQNVKSQIDPCSFNGLFGRIIYKGAWIDLFVYSNKSEKNEYTDECINLGCVYTSTDLGTPLPKTQRVKMNNIYTRVFNSDEFIHNFLVSWYGDNYIIPNHQCTNGQWKII